MKLRTFSAFALLVCATAAGEPLADCDIRKFIGDLSTPTLALRPQREFEIESVKKQMELLRSSGIRTYVADPGVHGSSMLVEERVQSSTESTWAVVLAFLEETVGTE